MHARPRPDRLSLAFLLLSLAAYSCFANDDCRDALPINCGDTVSGDTTAATTDGVWPCAAGGSDVWYRFVATEPVAILDLCGSTYDTAVMVLDGCGGDVLGCNDDSCGLQSQLAVGGLTIGNTYLVAVGGYNGGAGEFTLLLTCDIPQCDGAEARPGDVEENEGGDCHLDSFNGGCNSTPPVFSSIDCNQSVHGTSGTSAAIAYRDTDWWRFTVANGDSRIAYWTVTAEFPVLIGFLRTDCPQTDFIEGTAMTAPACTEITSTVRLPAGDYVAFVAPSTFTGVPCGSEYRGSLICMPCCPPPAHDQCADALPINCGDTVVGETFDATTDGTWPCAAGGRDVWYRFVATDSVATISLCDSSFDTALMVTDSCGGAVLGCIDDSCGLQSSLELAGLTPGATYFVAVGGFAGDAGSFTLNITCGMPSSCALAQPGDIEEDEPFGGCATDYVDAFNGACSGDPPVFSPIHCGDTIHGFSGTYTSIGLADRDTDAWRLTISGRTRVTWTVTADFPATIGFCGTTCPLIFVPNSTVSGPACVPLTTSAEFREGEYVALIRPTNWSGVPCGSQYRATLTCDAYCTGDLDYDGTRDLADLSLLLSEFGREGGIFTGDVDSDGDVDLQDLATLLSVFGEPC
ncbi:MAG: hypothetical protein IT450_07590 [Phycisphaerales bacterium]|nr:hypothetical protein [Phycisphaerales bacterium]